MSSPAGLRYSQADFLARWMPSSSRAGVILNPNPELAGSLRHVSVVGNSSQSLEPNDSFSSDFAPLPASADSSCLGVDGFTRLPGGERAAGTDGPLRGPDFVPARHLNGHLDLDSLDEMASKTQDLPLTAKLEELRKWQQHMQEQLKAHQLEELLRLQEEQQRLLGKMNESPHRTGDDSEISGSDWETSLQGASCHSPMMNGFGIPQGATFYSRQGQQLSVGGKRVQLTRSQNHQAEGDEEEEDRWDSTDDEHGQNDAAGRFQAHKDTSVQSNGAAVAEDHGGNRDTASQDRPIKPGIGGHKQTFEELLEEQLRLEEQRLKSARQQQSQDGAGADRALPKRTFLKRGEGLSRFTNNRKPSLTRKETKKDSKPPQPQSRTISRSNSEPTASLKGGANCTQRLPIQRKTAILNKENRLRSLGSPPQDVRAESKTARMKVLGSHQRQNTGGSETNDAESEGRQTKPGQMKDRSARTVGLMKYEQPNPVTKQVGVSAGNYTAKERNCGRAESGERRAGGGGDGAPLDPFEVSFQEKLQSWECDRQLENMELGEFELLEQAAEELSFSSNSSFVIKVLQMDRHHRQLRGAQDRHQRRLSSTPIKSPPHPSCALQGCSSDGNGNRGAAGCNNGAVTSDAFVLKTRDEQTRSRVDVAEEEGRDGGAREEDDSDVSSCESEEQEVRVKPPVFPSAFTFPAPSNPHPYDKRSYQDEDSCRDSDVSADESTLIQSDRDGRQRNVVFDDDDTWNDAEEEEEETQPRVSPVSTATAANDISPPERALMRKVATSRANQDSVQGSANQEPDPPPPLPASQLMTRLFPSLKPKTQNAPLPPPPLAPSVAPESETGQQVQQVQSRQLRERLAELEIEIERFRKENAALVKLRQENERNQENLRKERLEFEQKKSEELAKFEEHKREENKKLLKERKLFEKHVTAARAVPDKKEREEIQALKQQLISLQEELRRKESRWSSTHSRLRQQVESLSQENGSLREEVRVLEKLRLSSWKKNSGTAEKDKETRDAPGMFPNNVSSVTKGVKFASPLDSRGSGSSSSTSPPQSIAAAGRRGSAETGVMKSSLRRPSAPSTTSFSSSSSSLSGGRRTEEKPTAANKSQDKAPNQEAPDSGSTKRDSLLPEPKSNETQEAESAQEVITHPDGKVEKVLAGGDRLIVFPNGTRKEVSADGLTVKVTFFNGDTKQVTADQRVIYFYSEAQTTHVTYPDGIEVLHFPNNQTEKHFPDGRKEITFPDQTVKNLFPNGREESVLTDGTVIQVNTDGTKEIHFNTGQKEIHTADYKRREYPDGTVKTVYTDGRQETRYPTGRVRIKDKDGNVVLDQRT